MVTDHNAAANVVNGARHAGGGAATSTAPWCPEDMTWLDRLRGRAPDWCAPLDLRQYRLFMDLAEAELKRRAESYRRLPDDRIVLGAGPEERILGLASLAKSCARADSARWPELVREHFEMDGRVSARVQAWAGALHDFEAVRSRLRLQIVGSQDVNPDDDEVATSPALGLVALLVADFPECVVRITSEHLRSWPDEDVQHHLGTALRQTVRDAPIPGTVHALAGGAEVTSYRDADDSFVGTYAWHLSGPGGSTERGALVSIPSRNEIAIHDLVDEKSFDEAWAFMLREAHASHENAARPVSPFLYWRYRGTFHFLNDPDRPLAAKLPAKLGELLGRT